jgi:hypothetical protein
MEQIRKCLTKYREITLELISVLGSEDYDSLDSLLDNRQNLIDEISKTDYEKEAMNKIYEELQIELLQDKLNVAMNEKKEQVKANIETLSTNKIAKNGYTAGFKAESFFINKKI